MLGYEPVCKLMYYMPTPMQRGPEKVAARKEEPTDDLLAFNFNPSPSLLREFESLTSTEDSLVSLTGRPGGVDGPRQACAHVPLWANCAPLGHMADTFPGVVGGRDVPLDAPLPTSDRSARSSN
uniref:Uncharacterized protein n=1 Tax=Trichuris muris TaxID=70415 RepID=A0A5S6R052_TRIMR